MSAQTVNPAAVNENRSRRYGIWHISARKGGRPFCGHPRAIVSATYEEVTKPGFRYFVCEKCLGKVK